MPGLVRKLVVFAAINGLIVHPVTQHDQNAVHAICIEYKSHAIVPAPKNVREDATQAAGLEIFGIIGFLNIASYSYLIAITRRQQVAQLWGKPIYMIQDIAVIPLTSKIEAEHAIAFASSQEPVQGFADRTLEEGSDSDVSSSPEENHLDGKSSVQDSPIRDNLSRPSANIQEAGIAHDVINRRGIYGRFADSWFSSRGWITGLRRSQGMSSEQDVSKTTNAFKFLGFGSKPTYDNPLQPPILKIESSNESVANLQHQGNGKDESKAMLVEESLLPSLIPKLLQTTKLLFSSRTFFFSYDHDITRRLSSPSSSPIGLPLYKQADIQYFWNHHLMSPLLDANCEAFILPVMQGFIGQRKFALNSDNDAIDIQSQAAEAKDKSPTLEQNVSITEPVHTESSDKSRLQQDSNSYLLTLISRRSINRAGLRYLRRGIDENGSTANTVETEQILSFDTGQENNKAYSFVQTRGSMPLFFSQTPYTFKPVPILYASPEANQKALKKHFANLVNQYGDVQAVSLINCHGNEKAIGEAYEEQIKKLNDEGGISGRTIPFEWFDFHAVCRGMKFENVSALVTSMTNFLKSSSWSETRYESGKIKSVTRQTGIIRTNCMDCLDRTNVVQAAFAQFVLENQLSALSPSTTPVNLAADASTTWFNTLWADNGDAVSRAYAGTAALKGDYTRTRKRNLTGALTDLSLTLSRYYHNLFNDFFAQVVIDYLLGTVAASAFSEFETTMTNADPAIDLQRARQSAITTAADIVVGENEDLLAGWAVAAPPRILLATVESALPISHFRQLEEIVLVLSDQALYAVRYDWDSEKVRSFERIPLSAISGMQLGTYIVGTMTKAQLDPVKNYGLLIRHDDAAVRINTRSLDNKETSPEAQAQTEPAPAPQSQIIAFKALSKPPRKTKLDSGRTNEPSEAEAIRQISDEILRAIKAASMVKLGPAISPRSIPVVEADIVSVEEARQSTGIIDHLEYSLKRLVWG